MKYMYNLQIGDWSNDGHGQYETITVETNKCKEDIQIAYEASVEKTGIDLKKICNNYEESYITNSIMVILRTFDIPTEDIFEDLPSPRFQPVYSSTEFVKLYMWFAKLSLEDLQYEIVEYEILERGMGYGLYS